MGTYALLLDLLLTFHTTTKVRLSQNSSSSCVSRSSCVRTKMLPISIYEYVSEAVSNFKVRIGVSNRSTFPKPESLVWPSTLTRYTNSVNVISPLKVQYQ